MLICPSDTRHGNRFWKVSRVDVTIAKASSLIIIFAFLPYMQKLLEIIFDLILMLVALFDEPSVVCSLTLDVGDRMSFRGGLEIRFHRWLLSKQPQSDGSTSRISLNEATLVVESWFQIKSKSRVLLLRTINSWWPPKHRSLQEKVEMQICRNLTSKSCQ